MEKNDTSSLIKLLLSVTIFGTIGVFRRYISLSSSLLACARGILGSLFLILLVKLQGKKLWHPLEKKKVLLLILAGSAMGFNWILLFEAYRYTTVATATLCYYMQPTIVLLLSPVLFRERLGGKKLLCVFLSLLGMVLVSGILTPGSGSGSMKGVVLGLSAALLYSGVVILNKLVPGVDTYQKTVTELLSAALTLIPYILLTEPDALSALSAGQLPMLLLVGLLHTGVAYALYFGSMDKLRAQTIALLSYLDPVVALLLSVTLLGEPMSLLSLLGAALILFSAVRSELAY